MAALESVCLPGKFTRDKSVTGNQRIGCNGSTKVRLPTVFLVPVCYQAAVIPDKKG